MEPDEVSLETMIRWKKNEFIIIFGFSVHDIDREVTWTLQELEDGRINLYLEQTGFTNAQELENTKLLG
jgi:hypothetical protein